MNRILRRTLAAAALLGGALVAPAAASAASAGPPGEPAASCYDTSLSTTVEEQRLDNVAAVGEAPAADQILAQTGFDQRVAAFSQALCAAADADQATAVVKQYGLDLWTAAVERAQSAPVAGQLPPSDDRGLYWARISMSKLIRQWSPVGSVSPGDRRSLLNALEATSRGMTSSKFVDDGTERVLVTGFDPFTLDADIRTGNPSGATALSLDGVRWLVGDRVVQLQTVIFPVRYADFNAGEVEKALRSHYANAAQRADMVVTASQGRIGQFDLEVFNGRRRSTSTIGDNNNVQGGGTYTDPVVPPGMPSGPEFLESSLPIDAMSQASAAPFALNVNRQVVEIPAGRHSPVTRPDGPTAGSIAVEGSPGGYLSNEIAYRNTLLRERFYPDMPAGHLHLPVLQFGQYSEITDPTYEANRDNIVAASIRILKAGAAAVGTP